jgi:hypothetical protein
MANKKRKRGIKPVEYFVNLGGMVEDEGQMIQLPSTAEYIQNMHPSKSGQYTTYNQGNEDFSVELEGGVGIDCVTSFTPDTGNKYFAVGVNGKVLNINTGTGANDGTITTSNTAGNRVRFQTYQNQLYMVEKTMSPEYWDGTTLTTMTTFPLTNGTEVYERPELVARYKNRMVFARFSGSNNYKSHVVVLDEGDLDTLTIGSNDSDGGVFPVSQGDSQELTAMYRWYLPAQNSESLVLLKDSSVHILTGSTPATFQLNALNEQYGALNQECVVQIGSDLIFMGSEDIYSLTTATNDGSIQPSTMNSQRVRDTLNTLNLSQKDKCYANHIPSRYEVWFWIPTGASTTPDTALIYNYRNRHKGQDEWIIRSGFNATCGMVYDSKLYTGTSTGYIQKWFDATGYDGVGANWVYRFPWYSFGSQSQVKRILTAWLYLNVRVDELITVTTRWKYDGNEITKTISKTISGESGAVWDGALWDNFNWSSGEGKSARVYFPVKGNGEMFQLELSGTTASLGPELLGARFKVLFGDEAHTL